MDLKHFEMYEYHLIIFNFKKGLFHLAYTAMMNRNSNKNGYSIKCMRFDSKRYKTTILVLWIYNVIVFCGYSCTSKEEMTSYYHVDMSCVLNTIYNKKIYRQN